MPYYKTLASKVYYFDEASQAEALISEGAVEVTFEEALALSEANNAPTQEQVLLVARAQRDGLLMSTAVRIAPLQYAIDIDEATPEEVALLRSWKLYGVMLNRVDQQPGWPATPTWPVAPST